MRTKQNQEQHDRGVAHWASLLVNNGWSLVRSDLPGNMKPPEIGGHIPDIYGGHGVREIVIEIETADSINLQETKMQLFAFQNWKQLSPNRVFLLKIV